MELRRGYPDSMASVEPYFRYHDFKVYPRSKVAVALEDRGGAYIGRYAGFVSHVVPNTAPHAGFGVDFPADKDFLYIYQPFGPRSVYVAENTSHRTLYHVRNILVFERVSLNLIRMLINGRGVIR